MSKKKIVQKPKPQTCIENHDFFQLSHYSIGQQTLLNPAVPNSAKLVCRKCGKVIVV